MKALALIKRGNLLVPMEAEDDGITLTVTKERKKYFIRSKPMSYTRRAKNRLFKRPVNTYFVSEQAAVTFGDIECDGFTIDSPNMTSEATDVLDNGAMVRYTITAEQVYERSDSSDLKALNLAQGLPTQMLLLAMGAGAGLMVALYFIYDAVKGIHW